MKNSFAEIIDFFTGKSLLMNAFSGLKISVNDLLIKAVGTALQHVPQINLNTKGEDDIQVRGRPWMTSRNFVRHLWTTPKFSIHLCLVTADSPNVY